MIPGHRDSGCGLKKAYVESDEIDWRRRKEIIHMKILLIEDDKEISKMLRSYLMTENFGGCLCFRGGQMACEAFDTDTYSIVLLDLMIPKLTGMEVILTHMMRMARGSTETERINCCRQNIRASSKWPSWIYERALGRIRGKKDTWGKVCKDTW